MQDRIFYHIYPLGLLGAPKKNSFSSKPIIRLDELYPWLDHMQDLGCNALYLGPVFESTSHGYDTCDYYLVDRRLGTNKSLRSFVLKAHEKGIKVVLDGVFNHVGRDFWAFKDLQKRGVDSKYKDWFSNVNFKKRSPLGDAFSYDAWSGHYELVKLNLSNTEVKHHLFGAVAQWIEEYEIDGLRLDTADVLDFDFMKSLSKFCKELKPDFWLMGEVVQGDYTRWTNGNMLDAVTNYEYHTPFYESFNKADFSKIATILERQYGNKGVYKDLSLYSFVDNHDVNRAASSLYKPEHLYPLYLLLFTLPGIPSIYNGSEWGFEGKKRKGNDGQLRPKVSFDKLVVLAKHPVLIDALKRFIAIRKNNEILTQGSYQQLLVSKEQFAFSRSHSGKSYFIVVNASPNTETVEIAMNGLPNGTYNDLLNPEYSCISSNGVLAIEVNSCWGRILKY